MKKLLLVLAAVCCFTLSARAQLYLGGGIGFGTDNQNRFSVLIAPEIGYGVTSHFTVGGRLSYQSGYNIFGVDPYLRFRILNQESAVRIMATLHSPVKFASDYLSYGFYLQPGISIRLAERLRLECHIGAFGWGQVKSGNSISSGWKASVNSNTISAGIIFGI